MFQRNIRSIRQFVMMKNDERRDLLRTLSEQEYRDVINVAAIMPYVTMDVKSQGTAVEKKLSIVLCRLV